MKKRADMPIIKIGCLIKSQSNILHMVRLWCLVSSVDITKQDFFHPPLISSYQVLTPCSLFLNTYDLCKLSTYFHRIKTTILFQFEKHPPYLFIVKSHMASDHQKASLRKNSLKIIAYTIGKCTCNK